MTAVRGTSDTPRVVVEIEEPTGPGIDVSLARAAHPLARVVRGGGNWLGADRGALLDSDDGRGRRVPVLVALPASTFAGLHLEVEIVGGFRGGDGVTLVGRLPGVGVPLEPFLRVLARAGEDARWIDAREAHAAVAEARHAYRSRRSAGRILGGRAWRPPEGTAVEELRFTTSHSAAEYSLARVPPRFLRALDGLLDEDERLLYWVERPGGGVGGLLERFRTASADRRAAMLILSDRQLLWLVDHADPDRTMIDWGVDVEFVPVEAIRDVRLTGRDGRIDLVVATAGGALAARLPAELGEEAAVMERLLARFVPDSASRLPMRRYEVDAVAFDPEPASRFGQADEALALLAQLSATHGPALSFLFSPRRSGQRRATASLLTRERIVLADGEATRAIDPTALGLVRLTLSPLVGRLVLIAPHGERRLTYPAPFVETATALVRRLRRLWANAPSRAEGSGRSSPSASAGGAATGRSPRTSDRRPR